jgi:hypothetical protein
VSQSESFKASLLKRVSQSESLKASLSKRVSGSESLKASLSNRVSGSESLETTISKWDSLLSFTGMTKVLVATGQDRDSSVMEIIDLTDPSNVCQPLVPDNYPIDTVSGASGGRVCPYRKIYRIYRKKKFKWTQKKIFFQKFTKISS